MSLRGFATRAEAMKSLRKVDPKTRKQYKVRKIVTYVVDYVGK